MSIKIENVTKCFKESTALNNVSLEFKENKIYGLLGRNGAGKTTLLKCISGQILNFDGTILIDEACSNTSLAQSEVFFMSEKDFYPTDMKINQAIAYGKMFHKDFDENYANELFKKFKLDPRKKIGSLSTGYKTIFRFIFALATGKKYIFLDEPILGLDANHRDLAYREILRRYAQTSSTIVISTHLIEEVSPIIEGVIIIDKGKILIDKEKDEILELGYQISGTTKAVDEFCVNKKILAETSFGGLKTASVMGEKPLELADGLEIIGLDLQQFFIQLTNAEEQK